MPRYTKEQMIQALHETKGQITLAAKRVGCSYPTIKKYVDKYPDVAAAMTEELESMGDQVELTLYDMALGKRDRNGEYTREPNIAALIFLAKTKFKNRGYSERTEITGANGGAIQSAQVTIEANNTHDAANILSELANLGAIPSKPRATDNNAETE